LNTDLDSSFLYVARLDLETLEFETVVSAEWNIEHMTLSPDGTRLAYTINQGGISELRLMDLASGNVRAAPVPEDVPGVVPSGTCT
jgi:Tol biopolymer transport system component